MSKIIFDDGKEVVLSKKTEENLRRTLLGPRKVPAVFWAASDKVVIRLREEALSFLQLTSRDSCSFSLTPEGYIGDIYEIDKNWKEHYGSNTEEKPVFGEIEL